MAHIRRNFFDVHAAGGSPVAEQALQRLAKPYAMRAALADHAHGALDDCGGMIRLLLQNPGRFIELRSGSLCHLTMCYGSLWTGPQYLATI